MKKVVVLISAFLLAFSITAWGQEETRIVGTVTDSTGAVIPGAKVTVSNSEKGFNRQLTSDSAGYYAASPLPIGNYEITVEAPGFEKLVKSGITMQIGEIRRIDLQLTVGQVTQEVKVTAAAVQVQTENATVSATISTSQIENLDLNGRNWVSLALMVPGASPDNGLNTTSVGVNGNNSISFNGNRMQYANWEVDGGNNTDEGSASTFNTYPSLDSISEFRISTSTYGAEMGKHAGANIELATKSGTKTFHGDAWEYVRNQAFDANDYWSNRNQGYGVANAPKDPLKWNDWGYTFGGPFYIPGVYNQDKSKTFFFWSENWRRYRQGNPLGGGVPSLLERQGDFSQCDPKSANYNILVSPGCTLPSFQGKTYDTVQQVQAAQVAAGFQTQAALNQAFTNGTALENALLPLPNSGPVGWALASEAATNWRQEQIRVDQNIGEKTRVFYRLTKDAWNTVQIPSLWQWSSYDTNQTQFGGPGVSQVLNITHVFKPNLTNEFVAAYTTDHILLYPVAGSASTQVTHSLNRPSSFQEAHLFPANNSNPLLPDLEICGGSGFCSAVFKGNVPWFNSNPIITWKDNLAWVHGAHTTKVGLYLENYRKNEQFGTPTQGADEFGGYGPNTSGNAKADMFLGQIDTYQEGTQLVNGVAVGGYPKGHWQMTDLEPYIQDDWKIRKNLTLNLGVRYYIYSRIHDVTRPTVDSGFIPSQYSVAAQDPLDASGNYVVPATGATQANYGNGLVACGTNGIPMGCQKANTWGNIAPRFGFAWDPKGSGKTSIRGGFGIYYESGNGNESQTEGGEGNPPVAPGPSVSYVTGYQNIHPSGLLVPSPTGFTPIPGNQGWPSVYQYSFTVEHQLSSNDLISIAYVGAAGRHLARARDINQISPAGIQANNGLLPAAPALVANGTCTAAGCSQDLLVNTTDPTNLFRPYQGWGTMDMKENSATSSYNALQASMRHSFSHGLTLQAAYTWSHAIDNSTSTYQSSSFGDVNDYTLQRWKGTSDLNRTQVLQVNYIYALPFFKNSTHGFVRSVAGGWQISGIGSFFTGQPVDFACNHNGNSTAIGGNIRCDVVGKVAIDKGTFNDPQYGPTPTWWNSATVAMPLLSQFYANGEAGMFGNMGRNVLTGPGRENFDTALEKNFELPWFKGEHSTVQFRLESFNTFNHMQAKGFGAGCSGATSFGAVCSDNNNNRGNNEINSDWGPRNVQLGLKFIF